jgi:hypothetical protein
MGLIGNAYRKLTTPLLPDVAKSGAALEQEISRPQLSDADHPLLAAMRGFGAGAVKGMGNLSAGYTSPLSIATLTAGPMSKLASLASVGKTAASAEPIVDTGSRIAQGGFKLPEPKAVPTVLRMSELYKKFGMMDPNDPTYSTSIVEQMLNGR